MAWLGPRNGASHLQRSRRCWPLIALALAGCASLLQPAVAPPETPVLPSKKQLRVGPYVFITDVELKRDHPLLKELEGLPEQVGKELHLPASSGVTHVYLFADRVQYENYMQANFKNLPKRRAFFMARIDERQGDELMVYTYWGDRIQEDLRHELTHAYLHSVLKDVPMWLDEGLAEYFEVPPDWHGLNYRHLRAIRGATQTPPWTPNLSRLEKLTAVKDMTTLDYREAWAWTHLFLQGTPQSKAALLAYLQQLRFTKDPGPFEPQLATVYPSPEMALKDHVTKLEHATRTLSIAAGDASASE